MAKLTWHGEFVSKRILYQFSMPILAFSKVKESKKKRLSEVYFV